MEINVGNAPLYHLIRANLEKIGIFPNVMFNFTSENTVSVVPKRYDLNFSRAYTMANNSLSVVELCIFQGAGGVLDDIWYVTIPLSQYGSNRIVTCVTHDLECEAPIRSPNNGCRGQRCLQSLKILPNLSSKLKA